MGHAMRWMVGAWSAAGLFACSGEFHSDRNLEDMNCDSNGCFHCDRGDCTEYRCDATHQCPMQRICTIDRHCLLSDSSQTPGGGCTSHEDCPPGDICTLEGTCVKSPGGGPGADTSTPDTADTTETSTAPETSEGEITLPDHPDDTCRTNADCGTDGTCVNGGCYFACSIDGQCPAHQVCVNEQCRPTNVPENECTFNGECGTSDVCLEGTCFGTCTESLECPVHERCDHGLCVGDTTPVIQCSGAGSCDPGLSCIDGKCLAACDASDTCGSAAECKFGFCQAIPACFDQQDCSGNDCIDGTCTK